MILKQILIDGGSMKMDMKAAIFDMDGTLIDSLIFWDLLWTDLGNVYLSDPAFRPTKEDDKKVRTLTMKDAMDLIHENYNIGKNGEEVLTFANRKIVDFYSKEVRLKPGVREFLEHCRQNGTKMCIASATATQMLKIAMEHCEIEQYFPNVFSCGDLGVGKDQPDVYLLAQKYLGSKAEDTWVFEDSLVAIETATKIGFHTVAIYDPYNFGQEQMKRIADRYIAEGESLKDLI